jgi:hypothetical protein
MFFEKSNIKNCIIIMLEWIWRGSIDIDIEHALYTAESSLPQDGYVIIIWSPVLKLTPASEVHGDSAVVTIPKVTREKWNPRRTNAEHVYPVSNWDTSHKAKFVHHISRLGFVVCWLAETIVMLLGRHAAWSVLLTSWLRSWVTGPLSHRVTDLLKNWLTNR